MRFLTLCLSVISCDEFVVHFTCHDDSLIWPKYSMLCKCLSPIKVVAYSIMLLRFVSPSYCNKLHINCERKKKLLVVGF